MGCRKILVVLLLSLVAVQVSAQKLTREQYIEKYRGIAVRQMLKHKIPASIILAQGCLESGDGNSVLAQKANNHFGIKCHNGWTGKGFKHDDDSKDECFRKYDTAEDSYTDHSNFLTQGSRYNSLFDLPITDYKAWAHGLKAAGYATNPKYAQLLINIIEEYQLYRYDSGDAPDKLAAEDKAAQKSAKKRAKREKKLAKLEKKAAKAAQKSRKANEKLLKYKGKEEVKDVVKDAVKEEVKESIPVKRSHTIKAGDTLYSIARKYGTTVEAILKLNKGIKAQELKVGTQIVLE